LRSLAERAIDPVDDSIICTYEWTAARAEEALREHGRLLARPSIRWFANIILFAIGALILVEMFATGRGLPFTTLVTFFVVYSAILFGPFGPFMPWMRRRRFPRRPDAGVTIEWTANEEGLRVKTGDLTRSEVAWEAITKCVRVSHGFLIYGTEICFHGQAISHFLPDSGFASPELAVRFSHLAEQRALRFENRG
jgi:hypothetical protein